LLKRASVWHIIEERIAQLRPPGRTPERKKAGRKTAPGKSPRDALIKVIGRSTYLQEGAFTLKEYLDVYSKVREFYQDINPLAARDTTARNDLYLKGIKGQASLERQGLLRILEEKAENGALQFELTDKGRESIRVDEEVQDFDLPTLRVALKIVKDEGIRTLDRQETTALQKMETLLGIHGWDEIKELLIGALVQSIIEERTAQLRPPGRTPERKKAGRRTAPGKSSRDALLKVIGRFPKLQEGPFIFKEFFAKYRETCHDLDIPAVTELTVRRGLYLDVPPSGAASLSLVARGFLRRLPETTENEALQFELTNKGRESIKVGQAVQKFDPPTLQIAWNMVTDAEIGTLDKQETTVLQKMEFLLRVKGWTKIKKLLIRTSVQATIEKCIAQLERQENERVRQAVQRFDLPALKVALDMVTDASRKTPAQTTDTDAFLQVIDRSPKLQEGLFTVKEYFVKYRRVCRDLDIPANKVGVVRNGLYEKGIKGQDSLVGQGLLRILPERTENGAWQLELTDKGREAIEVNQAIHEMETLLGVHGWDEITELLKRASVRHIVEERIAQLLPPGQTPERKKAGRKTAPGKSPRSALLKVIGRSQKLWQGPFTLKEYLGEYRKIASVYHDIDPLADSDTTARNDLYGKGIKGSASLVKQGLLRRLPERAENGALQFRLTQKGRVLIKVDQAVQGFDLPTLRVALAMVTNERTEMIFVHESAVVRKMESLLGVKGQYRIRELLKRDWVRSAIAQRISRLEKARDAIEAVNDRARQAVQEFDLPTLRVALDMVRDTKILIFGAREITALRKMKSLLGAKRRWDEIQRLFKRASVQPLIEKRIYSLRSPDQKTEEREGEGKTKPGKSPKDALLKVIGRSPKLQAGPFTLEKYLDEYRRIERECHDIDPLADSDTTARNDLYGTDIKGQESLVVRGLLRILPERTGTGAFQFELTDKGRESIKVDQAVQGFDLPTLRVALTMVTDARTEVIYVHESAAVRKMESLLGVSGRGNIRKLLRRASARPGIKQRIAQLEKSENARIEAENERVQQAVQKLSLHALRVARDMVMRKKIRVIPEYYGAASIHEMESLLGVKGVEEIQKLLKRASVRLYIAQRMSRLERQKNALNALIEAANKRARAPRPTKPGKSPRDALLKVIGRSPRLQKGPFTLTEYLDEYRKIEGVYHDIDPLADSDTTARNDLYQKGQRGIKGQASLVKQGLLRILAERTETGAFQFKLTDRGRTSIKVDQAVQGFDLPTLEVALDMVSGAKILMLREREITALREMESFLGVSGRNAITELLKRASAQPAIAQGILRLEKARNVGIEAKNERVRQAVQEMGLLTLQVARSMVTNARHTVRKEKQRAALREMGSFLGVFGWDEITELLKRASVGPIIEDSLYRLEHPDQKPNEKKAGRKPAPGKSPRDALLKVIGRSPKLQEGPFTLTEYLDEYRSIESVYHDINLLAASDTTARNDLYEKVGRGQNSLRTQGLLRRLPERTRNREIQFELTDRGRTSIKVDQAVQGFDLPTLRVALAMVTKIRTEVIYVHESAAIHEMESLLGVSGRDEIRKLLESALARPAIALRISRLEKARNVRIEAENRRARQLVQRFDLPTLNVALAMVTNARHAIRKEKQRAALREMGSFLGVYGWDEIKKLLKRASARPAIARRISRLEKARNARIEAENRHARQAVQEFDLPTLRVALDMVTDAEIAPIPEHYGAASIYEMESLLGVSGWGEIKKLLKRVLARSIIEERIAQLLQPPKQKPEKKKPGRKTAPGKSPRDALLKVIGRSPKLQKGAFTLKGYLDEYRKIERMYQDIDPPADSDITARNDLYKKGIKGQASLVKQGLLKILMRNTKDGKLRFTLTAKGRESIKVDQAVQGFDLPTLRAALAMVTNARTEVIYVHESAVIRKMESLLEVRGQYKIRKLLKRASAQPAIAQGILRLKRHENALPTQEDLSAVDTVDVVISKYILRIGKDHGPGTPLTQKQKQNIWEAINLVHKESIEIFLPQKVMLTKEINETILAMEKKGVSIEIRRYKTIGSDKFNGLFEELGKSSKRTGVKKLVITTPAISANLDEYLEQHPRNPNDAELLRNVRLLNLSIPSEWSTPEQETLFQAQMLMRALIAAVIEEGQDHFVDMKALLTELLEDSFESESVDVGEFVGRLLEVDGPKKTPEDIITRIRYFLDSRRAINLIEQLEVDLWALEEFWTYA
jgi:predicted transcriptional regulator